MAIFLTTLTVELEFEATNITEARGQGDALRDRLDAVACEEFPIQFQSVNVQDTEYSL